MGCLLGIVIGLVLLLLIYLFEPWFVFLFEAAFVVCLAAARVLWRLLISRKWMVESQSQSTVAHVRWQVRGWRGAAKALAIVATRIESGHGPKRSEFDFVLGSVGAVRQP